MLVTHGFRPRHSLRERRPRELTTGALVMAIVSYEPAAAAPPSEGRLSEGSGPSISGSRLARISRPPVREANAAAESWAGACRRGRRARRRGGSEEQIDSKTYDRRLSGLLPGHQAG